MFRAFNKKIYSTPKKLLALNNDVKFNIFNVSKRVTTWTRLTSAFNSKPSLITSINISNSLNNGLFGIPELTEPNGFNVLKERAISQANHFVLEALDPKRSRKMVQVFDDLSDCLCQVADLAEFVRVGHPDSNFAKAAEDASMSISCLVETLNTNPELYRALKKVVEEGDVVQTDDIDNYVAKLFLFDFEQCGIHLDSQKREQVVKLNDAILHYGAYFMDGTIEPRTILKSQLPESIRSCFSKAGDTIVISELHADSPNERIREAAYKIFYYPEEKQHRLLHNLLSCRHQLAQLCGFPSYSHRAINGSLAGSPDFVHDFLEQLSIQLHPRAQKDYNELLKLKQHSDPYAKVLHPWDVPYFTSQLKQESLQVKLTALSPYLSLGACMEGLNMLVGQLFGLSLQVEPTYSGECWYGDVIKLAVKESDTTLGYIYCDFYERPGKLNQDCHFTIQGGRRVTDPTTGETSYQLPIVVIMLNLPAPGAWSQPSLLQPGMVANLFHETGHALHSMLARTPYQHVTGTRCSTDLAELPSILMEYFASDPRVLHSFARHHQTGKPIPVPLLDQLHRSRHLLAASDAQVQAFYAHLDQALHSQPPEKIPSTVDVLAQVQARYHGIPHVPNTAAHLRFGHLVGYGAKYYSYSVSRALASLVWYDFFKPDPFSSKAGEKYRHEVLAHGGSKPPRKLIQDFLQREITPSSLSHALIKDLDDEFTPVDNAL